MNFYGKYKRLNKADQALRLGMLDWGLLNGGEIPREKAKEFANRIIEKDSPLEWQGYNAEEIIASLHHRHYLSCTDDGDICFLYPYSAYPTDYRVTLGDGRSFYAMCAIDSMGSAVTFNQTVEITSLTSDTNEELYLNISPDDGIVGIIPDTNLIATYYDTTAKCIDFNC